MIGNFNPDSNPKALGADLENGEIWDFTVGLTLTRPEIILCNLGVGLVLESGLGSKRGQELP